MFWGTSRHGNPSSLQILLYEDADHTPGRTFMQHPRTVSRTTSYSILGLYINIGTVEKKMETTIVCWGSIGIMEKKMQSTIWVLLNLTTIA